MVENIKRINNPLTIIGIFAALAEVSSTVAIGLIDKELQYIFVWFLIGFPTLLAILFFSTLNFNQKVMYSPSDYKEENNFVKIMVGNKDVPADLERLKKTVRNLETNENENDVKDAINEIERIQEKSQQIPINYLWDINHWGSNYASIQNGKMIFTGSNTAKKEDGSNININDLLEIGKAYEISCFIKSTLGTTAMFQLWCTDQVGSGISTTTQCKIPSQKGEKVGLFFQPKTNKNIRIHLQYTAGQGQIEVSDVRITELSS